MRPVRGYAAIDAARWEADWRAFVENERPVIQRTVEPSPLVSLKADHGLIALFRAHAALPRPNDGGDLLIEPRLAINTMDRSGVLVVKYSWSTPIAYTMTLCFPLPSAMSWLRPMLRAGGCWASCAPRPDLGLLWLPAPTLALES